MRRLLTALAVAAVVGAALVAAGMGGGDRYLVRAIFDNAGFVVKGEDVKVAGVPVGSVESLELTPDNRAVVVLDIEDPAYQDFRADAHCTVRPQSLIGEEYVECVPTRPRPAGAAPPPPLRVLRSGPGKGQRLLPVEQTGASVDLDLVAGALGLPERQRLAVVLNELGAGVAGRGRDLNAVIRRANPALRELDEVLQLLAKQNRALKQLATDSDRLLGPLARERGRVGDAVDHVGAVASAAAERRAELEAAVARLPGFLRELRPTMARLASLSAEATPVVADLRAAAPSVDRLLAQLGPFARAGTPALRRLGAVASPGVPALRDSLPVVGDLQAAARRLRPVGATLRAVLDSFQGDQGIERALDYIYYQVLAINGFDSAGHFLRAALILNRCSTYSVDPVPGCSANFSQQPAREARGAARMPSDEILRRTAAVLAGADPRDVLGRRPGRRGGRAGARGRREERRRGPQRATRRSPRRSPEAAPAAPSRDAPAAVPAQPPVEALLDYLLGGTP